MPLARYKPANLLHVVFDNESLLSVGGFPTATGTCTRLAEVAAAAGVVGRHPAQAGALGVTDDEANTALAIYDPMITYEEGKYAGVLAILNDPGWGRLRIQARQTRGFIRQHRHHNERRQWGRQNDIS